MSKDKHGKNAEDMIVKVPPGTVVTDDETGAVIADLVEHGQTAVIARGGRGGRGNSRFAIFHKTQHLNYPKWVSRELKRNQLRIKSSCRCWTRWFSKCWKIYAFIRHFSSKTENCRLSFHNTRSESWNG